MDGDVKTVWLKEGENFNIVAVGTDYGRLNYVVEEYDADGNPIGRSIFYDVELYEGRELTTDFAEDTDSFSLQSEDEIITADEYLSAINSAVVFVDVEVDGSGSVSELDTYVRGDSISLLAIPDEGYMFCGWFFEERCISLGVDYVFTAVEDVKLTAQFIKNESVFPYAYNTPDPITVNGVTATVTFDNSSPQTMDTSITATVTLSGTAQAVGTHTIDLSSQKVGLASDAQTKIVAANDTPDDTYTFTFTMPSEDIDDLTLTHTFSSGKLTQNVPSTPTLVSKNATQIIINTITNAEYSIDDGETWQDSTTFNDLSPNTEYSIIARLKEDSTHDPSLASSALIVTTDKAMLSGTVAITGDTKYGATLTANISGFPADAGTLTYQWKRGTAIVGTNSNTYTLTTADIGSTITVTVTAANYDGSVTDTTFQTISKADAFTLTYGINVPVADVMMQIFDVNTVIGIPADISGAQYALGAFSDLPTPDNVLVASPTFNSSSLSYTGAGQSSGAATQVINITSDNYSNSNITITFTATDKADVSTNISFSNGTTTFSGSTQTYENASINAIAAGSNPQWTYTYSAVTGTLSGGFPLAAGTYTVTAKYEDSDNVGEKNATFTIEPKNLSNVTVVANFPNVTYTGSAQTPVPTGVTFDSTTAVVATDYTLGTYSNNVNAGQASVVINGTGNYSGTKTVNFTISPKSLTLKADDKTILVNASEPTYTYTVEGLVGGDTKETVIDTQPSLSVSGFDNSTASTFIIEITGGSTANSNYIISTRTNGTLTVTNKTPVTITGISVANKTYNGAAVMPTGAIVVNNGSNNLTSAQYGTLVYAYTNTETGITSMVAPKDAGSYKLVVSIDENNTNYTGSSADISFTIAKSTINITADNKSADTGSAQPIYTYTVTGLAPGETLSTLPTFTCTPNMNTAGTYTITPSGAAVPNTDNYNGTITYVIGMLTVSAPYVPPYNPDPTPIPTPAPTPAPTPFETIDVTINGQTVTASIGEDGTLTLTYTADDLGQYADDTGVYEIAIPEQQDSININIQIEAIGEDDLSIKTDFGTIQIPNTTLQSLSERYSDTLRLVIVKGSFKIAFLDANGKEIPHNDPANPLTISLPYTLGKNGKPSTVVAISKGGKIIPFAVYQNGSISFDITSTGTYDVVNNEKPFNDIPTGHWAENYIDFVAARSIYNGDGKGNFAPNDSMTRAMFTQVLANLEGVDLTIYTSCRFTDVSDTAWYAAAVEWAAENSIVGGIGNGKFAPEQNITREQMALMLINYMDYKGYKLAQSAKDAFSDETQINAWAYDAVKAVQAMGIVSGKPGNVFDPQGTATRAEVATIFARFIELMSEADSMKSMAQIGTDTEHQFAVFLDKDDRRYSLSASDEADITPAI